MEIDLTAIALGLGGSLLTGGGFVLGTRQASKRTANAGALGAELGAVGKLREELGEWVAEWGELSGQVRDLTETVRAQAAEVAKVGADRDDCRARLVKLEDRAARIRKAYEDGDVNLGALLASVVIVARLIVHSL